MPHLQKGLHRVLSAALEGERHRNTLSFSSGISAKAQCTGNERSYLEPNSGCMHVPIEGVYRASEKIEDRSRIGKKHNQNHVENAARTYLERIRNRMQKPIEGLPAQQTPTYLNTRYKSRIVRQTQHQTDSEEGSI